MSIEKVTVISDQFWILCFFCGECFFNHNISAGWWYSWYWLYCFQKCCQGTGRTSTQHKQPNLDAINPAWAKSDVNKLGVADGKWLVKKSDWPVAIFGYY